jgi:hypothetical protein
MFFHIHQLHCQLTEIDGKTLPFIGRPDIVKMPVHGTIKILLPFTDPVQVGKLVYHCDIVLARRQRHDADHRGSAVTGEPEQPARIGSKDGTKRLRIGLLGCYFPMEDGKERF